MDEPYIAPKFNFEEDFSHFVCKARAGSYVSPPSKQTSALSYSTEFVIELMTLKFLAAGLMAATLIGCADKIEVPNDDPVNLSGRVVYNLYDEGNREVPPSIKITEANGALVKDLGTGLLGSTGAGRIVFSKFNLANTHLSEIYTTDADGNNQRLVASVFKAGQRLYGLPVVSANGKVVAWATRDSISEGTEYRSLHVVNIDGTAPRELTNGLAYETQHSISPNGDRVAYFRSNPGSNWLVPMDLIVSRTDGTGSVTIKAGIEGATDFGASIAWSPDGQRIAYGAPDGIDEYAVYVVNASGGIPQRVAAGAWPTWAPDGQGLAWTGYSQGQLSSEIYYSTDLGLTAIQLTATTEYESEPQFSPDGKTVMCTIWNGEPHESNGRLKLINLESKQASTVAEPITSSAWIR